MIARMRFAPLAACLALSVAAPARAQPNVEEANERIERGEALFRAGDFDGAVAEFERAYDVIGDAPGRFAILYNIGRAHERRFRYDLAMRYYRRFLEEGGPDAPQRPRVEATIAALEGLLATLHVELTSPGMHGEVWVEDRQVGEAPGDVLVPSGRHVIEVRADGYAPARREIQIAARSEETLSFTLSPYTSGLAPGWFWASTIGAGLTLAAGAALGIAALVLEGQVAGETDPVEMLTIPDRNQTIQSLALSADVFFGTGAALGLTAIVLALFTRFGPAPEASVALRVAPFASYGLALEGSW
jgi:tetratricopeptide (TPR) repeat protein